MYHIICLLDHIKVAHIPERYILKRYCRNARDNQTFNRKDYVSTASDGSSLLLRHTVLMNEAMDIVVLAADQKQVLILPCKG
jgi:hypothetical protein